MAGLCRAAAGIFPRFGRPRRGRAGQAAVEYVLAAGVLLACVGVLAVALYALRQHAGRVIALMAADAP